MTRVLISVAARGFANDSHPTTVYGRAIRVVATVAGGTSCTFLQVQTTRDNGRFIQPITAVVRPNEGRLP